MAPSDTTTPIATEHDLRNFAGYVTALATQLGTFGLPLGPPDQPSQYCRVHIVHRHSDDVEMDQPIWDTVYIDGVSYGNRHGGIAEYTRRFAEAHDLLPVERG